MSMSEDEGSIVFLLNTINEWEDIPAKFEELGIRGFCGDATSCPVANYLKRFTDLEGITVGPIGATWIPEDVELPFARVPLPERVKQFYQDFDDEKFPNLIMSHKEVGAYV